MAKIFEHTKTEIIVRTVLFSAGESACLFTFIYLLIIGETASKLALALISTVLLAVPVAAERLMNFKINLAFYVFLLIYIMGVMVGDSYKLYYLLPGWDKMLHTLGGITFSVAGFYIAANFIGNVKHRQIACAIFALCFSMALSLMWEFYEYAVDRIFNIDMQQDTVVNGVYSYYLNDELGVIGSITNIEETNINGDVLSIVGYLDIGLIDTMTDTLFESLGALLTAVLLALDNFRHRMIVTRTTEY